MMLILAIMISSCQIPVKEKQALKLQQETNRRMVSILSGMEKLQTNSLLNYLDHHESRRFYINGKSFKKDTLLQYLELQYQDLSAQKLKVIDPRAIVISHKSVLWTAEISAIRNHKDGKSTGEYRTDSWLWQKIDDNWMVTHFNLSSSGKM